MDSNSVLIAIITFFCAIASPVILWGLNRWSHHRSIKAERKTALEIKSISFIAKATSDKAELEISFDNNAPNASLTVKKMEMKLFRENKPDEKQPFVFIDNTKGEVSPKYSASEFPFTVFPKVIKKITLKIKPGDPNEVNFYDCVDQCNMKIKIKSVKREIDFTKCPVSHDYFMCA